MTRSLGDTTGSGSEKPGQVPVLSIVVPMLNEEDNIVELHERVKEVVQGVLRVSFELIYVDDGSTDGSWEVVKRLRQLDPSVKGIKLTRNFGHQIALRAGVDQAIGDAVIMMDCDLQHPPHLIERLYGKWRDGYDIVNTVKLHTDNIGLFRKWAIKLGYRVINLFSDINIRPGAADFRLVDRKVVEFIKQLNESNLLFRGIVNWTGHKSTDIEFNAEERFRGDSKYSYGQLASLVVWGVMSFSSAPIRPVIFIGLLASLFGFIYAGLIAVQWLFYGIDVPGWTTTTMLILLFGGFNLLLVGLIGEYVTKIHDDLKRRPPYVVADRLDDNTSRTPQ